MEIRDGVTTACRKSVRCKALGKCNTKIFRPQSAFFSGFIFYNSDSRQYKPVRRIHVELFHLNWADLQGFLTTC